ITLGRVRFALLLIGGAILGSLAHATFDPESSIPLIGASCAISGVMVYYALSFPQARIGIVVGPWYQHVSMPAIGYIACWVGLQCFGAYQQVQGFTSVSALGHLGGAIAGLLMWFYWSARWGKLLGGQPA
ncbi:MAG: rhomboid family intramembrane serine protease, partial [Planctomycetota bacterium]